MNSANGDEMTIDPILSPLMFVYLAADMAGFGIESSTDAEPSDELPMDGDFDVSFGLKPGLSLKVSHQRDERFFRVMANASELDSPTQVWAMALRLNHHMPPTLRFSLDEAHEDNLVLAQTISAEGLTLDVLATVIEDVSQIMQLVLQPEIMVAPDDSGAFSDQPFQAMIRV